MLYRIRHGLGFVFFSPSQFSAQSPSEWRGAHALSLTYKLHNFKCHAVSSPKRKMFLPLTIKAHCCVGNATRHLFFYNLVSETKVFLLPLCLFPFKKIVLHNTYCHMYSFFPPSPRVLRKASPIWRVFLFYRWQSKTHWVICHEGFSSAFYSSSSVNSHQRRRGRRQRNPGTTLKKSVLLAAAQPIKKGRASSLLLVFKNVVFSYFQRRKLVHEVIFRTNLMQACFCPVSAYLIWKKNPKQTEVPPC